MFSLNASLSDGRLLSGSKEGFVRLWRVTQESKTCIGTFKGRYTHSSLQALVSLHNDCVVLGYGDGEMEVWSLSEKVPRFITNNMSFKKPLTALVVLSDGRFVSGYDDGRIQVCTPMLYDHGSAMVVQQETNYGITALAALPNYLLLTAHTEGIIQVWSLSREQVFSFEFAFPNNGHYVAALTVLKESGYIVGRCDNENIQIWKISENHADCVIKLSQYSVNSRELLVLSANDKNQLQLWCTGSLTRRASLFSDLWHNASALPISFPRVNIASSSEVLGEGGFGVVYKAKMLPQNVPVAVKVPNASEVSEKERAEMLLHIQLSHFSILSLYGVVQGAEHSLVMELMSGSFRSLYIVDQARELPWLQCLEISLDVAEGLFYLHSLGIIHRDIKSDNILLNANGRAKVADFGLSKTRDYPTAPGVLGFVGTHEWMAPELFQNYEIKEKLNKVMAGVLKRSVEAEVYSNESTDVYSLCKFFEEVVNRGALYNNAFLMQGVRGWNGAGSLHKTVRFERLVMKKLLNEDMPFAKGASPEYVGLVDQSRRQPRASLQTIIAELQRQREALRKKQVNRACRVDADALQGQLEQMRLGQK